MALKIQHLCFSFLIATLPLTAAASLGGNVDSITNDQTSTRAQMRAVPSNGYTIHELTTEGGITVREFASADGVVFAIAWHGPTIPDLEQLLGSYFPQFRSAMAQRHARGIRGPVALQQDDLVVESQGHMRDYSGRAYVPSLLPPQVTVAEIQ